MNHRFVLKQWNSDETDRETVALTQERLALLSDAGRKIGSTLDIGETGRELIDVVVPRFADAAGILVQDRLLAEGEFPVRPTDGSAEVRRVAVGVADDNPEEWQEAFPVDELVVYPAWTPYARCMATGAPVLFTTMDTETAEDIARSWRREVITGLLDHASMLLVPLKARGNVLGFIVFTRKKGSLPFDEHDVTLAEELALRTAVCIDNARLYNRERRTALALQRGLLPAGLPTPLGLDVASRYLPASDLTGVGGDWFDVITLPGYRVALVVGDVMGHGTRAAATMGQLRTAVRTLASLDLTPAEVLYRLDLLAQDLGPAQIATCVYAVYDPVTQVCSIARAGHVPPILLHADGESEIVEMPSGVPLGIGGEPFEMIEITLPDAATLVLCTDGLVESRESDIDAGLEALCESLTGPPRDLERLCDMTLGGLRRGYGRDDIALLVARVRPLGGDEFASWTLPADPRSVREARAHARATLAAWDLSALSETTELLVSELVTNAVQHGRGEVTLRLLRGRTLMCEIADRSAAVPSMRKAAPDDETGRGLQLINLLAHRWGTRQTPEGKIVWCEQRLPG
ncbi:ATP-binding SpoIIE family protein phosphatase [Bailinhaonella thermotolerans]|uniref:protein-serine/threonine phosphatase n=1 Tax=Bailinhaonella thermotolerans TaxID=1070861 RepID=A0A3A4AXB0_9ACTN|nr:SpoIIE family protein phosphatase [Bailinhaonella thermotolerans]RJL34615.1 GAF domain-containing protein [Bailinhaonella thermotolerans]